MFITSVIMVVVMAIALTTSSLAWFSAAGTPSVTTNALKIQAKSTASAGLQISTTSSDGPWYHSRPLAESDLMVPADMVLGGTAIADYTDGDGTKEVTTALDCLVGERFVTNTINSNGQFEGTPTFTNASGAALYYTDTIWISSVDTALDKNVQASIAWTTDGSTPYDTVGTNDPILYVAVLAAKNDSENADRSTPDGYADWEILAIFNSAAQSTVRLGADAAHYASTATVSQRGNTPAIADLECTSQTTTSPLEHITTNSAGELQAYGSSREFKIVAWYDGASLYNANSSFEIYFALTFTAVAVVSSGS